MELEIVYLNPKELTPYEKNTRKHGPVDIEGIKESISADGFNDPIGIWGENNLIVEGHGRQLAAIELGIDKVPCIRLDHLTDEQRRDYAIRHNRTAEQSSWEWDVLEKEIKELETLGHDFSSLNFEFPEGAEEQVEIIEDEPPEPPEEPKAKYGDVYELGRHRLMCGDSTKSEDVSILMGGEKADLVVTDPPYNVAIGDKNKALQEFDKAGHITENIQGDNGMTDEECGKKIWKPAFENLYTNAKDKCAIYCFMPQGGTHMMMMMMMHEAKWQVKHELIWVKNIAAFSMGRLDYDYKHEPILYGWKKGHNFYSEFTLDSVIEDQIEDFSKMKKEALIKMLEEIFSDKRPVSVIREDRTRQNNLHPTMKPIKLLARLINNSSRQDELIVDLFGGSGSTLIACEQMNRRCNVMEIDPKYVDVIIERWEQFTGGKAKKIKSIEAE